MSTQSLVPRQEFLAPIATSARSDQELVDSWLASMRSQHSRDNFATTAERFLAALGRPMREATVEDVRRALVTLTDGVAASSARQYVLRCKGLLSYGHRLGYLLFNAGAAIKAPREVRALAKRIITEVDVADLIRSSVKDRDYLLSAVAYAAGLRVSELVGVSCGDVLAQGKGRVQLHIVGKGGKEREVLLPEDLGAVVLAACDGRPPSAPLFESRKGRQRLSERGARHLIKRLAKKAGLPEKVSPHWLRHAHASHALDHGAPLPVVAATLGHANISTTSAYLHAKPGTASGDSLDAAIWKSRHRTSPDTRQP